ncbi:MAG: hypothetical protein EBW58_12650 [Betaproteobacteria bacterium]|nr:hypothetical protein [Betaproteobacteria bacterium]
MTTKLRSGVEDVDAMNSDDPKTGSETLANLPMSKEAFMAKWAKLSPRAQQELLDLAKEQRDLGNDMPSQD